MSEVIVTYVAGNVVAGLLLLGGVVVSKWTLRRVRGL